MNVLIVPRDFRRDRYIIRPLFRELFKEIGRPRARVQVCTGPLLGGVNEALKHERIAEVVAQHAPMTHMFILCVDRDGAAGRRARLDDIGNSIGNAFGGSVLLLAENAWEEVETRALAGLILPTERNRSEVRAEIHVKERYFDPLARNRGLDGRLDGGRKIPGEEAARRVAAIRRKCQENFDALAMRVEAAI